MRAGTSVALLILALPGPLAAQGFLEQFSYEGLRFAGIGADVGAVFSDRLERDVTAALRVDYGMIAPSVRTLFGISYFRSRFEADEIRRFEEQLNALVDDPGASISVGDISWTNVTLDLDLQYIFGTARRVTPYVGLGIGIHVRDASGTAIEGTFVEDALDTVAAGLNVSGGAEITVVGSLRATVEGRGLLTSELLATTVRAGLMLRFPGGGAGR